MWNAFSIDGRQVLNAGTTLIPHTCGMVVTFLLYCTRVTYLEDKCCHGSFNQPSHIRFE